MNPDKNRNQPQKLLVGMGREPFTLQAWHMTNHRTAGTPVIQATQMMFMAGMIHHPLIG